MSFRLRTIAVLLLVLPLLGAARSRPTRRAETPPTFANQISRIFQANCQTCHHPGDIAPFSLMSYDDALPYAGLIRLMTQTRKMPPWKPAEGCGEFEGTRRLSQQDIDLIAKWVDAGAPEGNRAELPPPREFLNGWSLGQPDLVLTMPEPYTPPAQGDMYRCFPIPTKLGSDQYVSAIDIRPGDRGTVHHVIAYLDTTGESERLDALDPGPGYTSFGGPGFTPAGSAIGLGGWAPGARPVHLPDGVAMNLPANARVVLQVHYHPHHGQPLPDQTEIGIYFSDEPPSKLLYIVPILNTEFVIPPGASSHEVTASWPIDVPVPIHIVSVAPHMHLLGRSMKVEATSPDGQRQCLIEIGDWDFNWQGLYQFREPVAIAPGTRLGLTARYDNSSSNPRNPNNPPKEVRWGEKTTDEMCIAFIGFTVDAQNLALSPQEPAGWMSELGSHR